ncbi:outer membrane beta-barrel protein [bacterium]|nr:outer membrane beta-barrel protein [bacterium]
MKLLLLLMMMAGTTAASAQAALLVLIFGDKAATETFHFSIDAGANYDVWTEGQPKLGWHFGLGNHLKLSEKWSLRAEFTPLNNSITDGMPQLGSLPDSIAANLTDRNNQWRINTIDVPILMRYRLNPEWSISVGPQVSFCTSATERRTAVWEDGSEITLDFDFSEQINPVWYGAALDISYSLVKARGGKGLDIGLRYAWLTGISNADPVPNSLSRLQFGLSLPFVN